MNTTLKLTEEQVQELAGERGFTSGRTYWLEGRVRQVQHSGTSVTATVRGKSTYDVAIWVEQGDMLHQCTCPLGLAGAFCKHLVALSLAWLASNAAHHEDEVAATTLGDLRRHLATKTKDELIELLIAEAGRSDALRDRLALATARGGRHRQPQPRTDTDNPAWKQFTARPGFESYKQLKMHSERTGQWPAWRDRALAVMRDDLKRQKEAMRGRGKRWLLPPDHTELVRMLLWDGNTGDALREAQEGGCEPELWSELASACEESQPEDAIRIYWTRAEESLRSGGEGSVAQAMADLRRVERLMNSTNRAEEFQRHVARLALTHRQNRQFIDLLKQRRWV